MSVFCSGNDRPWPHFTPFLSYSKPPSLLEFSLLLPFPKHRLFQFVENPFLQWPLSGDSSGGQCETGAFRPPKTRRGSGASNPAGVEDRGGGSGSGRGRTVKIGRNKNEDATSHQTTKHLFSGAVAAVVSRTFVAPLERLKLEYMVRGATRNIVEIVQVMVMTEGIKGFWKGNVVNLLRTTPFKSLNFFCFDVYRKQILEIVGKDELNNFERFAAGAAAGITATLLCFPMDTIRTKMVAPGGEALGGIISCMRHMVQTEGFSSLYKGLVPAVIAMAPSGAVFYGVYDILKTSYLQSKEGKEDLRTRLEKERGRRCRSGDIRGDLKEEAGNLGQLELGHTRTLLYGAIAGICAEVCTYPFEVIRRQLQMQNAAANMGALAICQQLVQKGGLSALYSGLLPSSLQAEE